MPKIIYLDESGDLGWTFGAPYRKGGSSRHLTIGAISVSHQVRHLPGRLIRNLYKKFSWDPKIEKKWTDMTVQEKTSFSLEADKMIKHCDDIKFFSITAYKPRVKPHITEDPNKLYNYLIKLLLLDEMAKHEEVEFYPDSRSIKVTSGDSLGDYLQTELYFTKNVKTKLKTIPKNSIMNKGIQFSDMLSGVVQQHYEDGNSNCFNFLKQHIHHKTWMFTSELEMV